MAEPNQRTLFHLVPWNLDAKKALGHRENQQFISTSSIGEPGLEVGYHVQRNAEAVVIATVGRKGGLIIKGGTVAKIHIAFEVHPETKVVLLSVRRRNLSSVSVSSNTINGQYQRVEDKHVLWCDASHFVNIDSQEFAVIWYVNGVSTHVNVSNAYRDAVVRARAWSGEAAVPKADPVESCLITRIDGTRPLAIQEVYESRKLIDPERSTQVFRTIHRRTGAAIAVKEVHVQDGTMAARLEHAKTDNVMQCLDIADCPGLGILYMPRLEGSLASLVEAVPNLPDDVYDEFIPQTLSGLDYLASKGLWHGAVKPGNILYKTVAGHLHFQLADFGLPYVLQCSSRGTKAFMAPELVVSGYQPPLWTHKMDVWSLFVTIASVHRDVVWLPGRDVSYERQTLPAIRHAATQICKYDIMAREDPADRASAAQCLLALYGGKGISTPGPITPVPRRAGRLAEQAAAGRQEMDHLG